MPVKNHKSAPEFLKSVKTGKGLIKLVNHLNDQRKKDKIRGIKRKSLSRSSRIKILDKTDGKCHICGTVIDLNGFHADHVKAHVRGGAHDENNYLPSCTTCNSLRWHYSSEEIQIILKLGRWLKSRIMQDKDWGLEIANEFIRHEMNLRKRRKN